MLLGGVYPALGLAEGFSLAQERVLLLLKAYQQLLMLPLQQFTCPRLGLVRVRRHVSPGGDVGANVPKVALSGGPARLGRHEGDVRGGEGVVGGWWRWQGLRHLLIAAIGIQRGGWGIVINGWGSGGSA